VAKNHYIGHASQISGVEEHRLVGGKGDGMRLLEIRNGSGLELTVSSDRCADISRLSYKGVNLGYFSPCGYVAPQYYDKSDFGFLKSFTCGFMTTCGLTTVGSPSEIGGELFPLHGNISHVPAEQIYYVQDEEQITIHAKINDSAIFKHKLELNRKFICSTVKNTVTIEDTIKNCDAQKSPFMLLYHFNMGYPLLDENTELYIPAEKVEPRDARAAEGIGEWNQMVAPQAGFVEQCYYHLFNKKPGCAMLFNKKAGRGLSMRFDTKMLDNFIEWKMMGERDYVLGLEPSNSPLDGRKALAENGTLKYLQPGEEQHFRIEFEFFDNYENWCEKKKG
jgi:hypothetical protein